jgi:hypothetical protein
VVDFWWMSFARLMQNPGHLPPAKSNPGFSANFLVQGCGIAPACARYSSGVFAVFRRV